MDRIYYTWDKWECYPAGMYETRPPSPDMTDDDCREACRTLLANTDAFTTALDRVLNEWPNSTEHYLTATRMNRIAWLGQASLCITHRIPAKYRGGYMLLTPEQRLAADQTALAALNRWLAARGEEPTTLAGAGSKNG